MTKKSKKILSEISAGELLDKISILEIKLEKINNKVSLNEIKKEYKILIEIRRSAVELTDEIKAVLPSNYIKMNFVAPFKVEGKNLHIAISDSSKLGLMRNLKAITKKNIEFKRYRIS